MTDPLQLLEPPPAVLVILGALRDWKQLVDRHGADPERIALRKPADTTSPWVWIRSAGGYALSAAHGAWSRLVQVESCATAPVAGELPELFTERSAASIATYLETAGAGLHQGTSWRARLLDGPNDLTDTSRGNDAPVYKHAVRLDVRLHAPV